MATDIKSELGRPVTIALAVAAALGWSLALWAFASNASQERGYEEQIAALRQERTVVVQELDALRARAGTAAEVGQRVEAGQAELKRLEAARLAADGEYEKVQKSLEAARVRLTEIARETEERTARLGTLRQEVEQAGPRRQALQAEIARLDKDVAARARNLEGIEARLEAVRQEEARLRAEVSRLGQALAEERAAGPTQAGTPMLQGRDPATTSGTAAGSAGAGYRCQQTADGWRCTGSE